MFASDHPLLPQGPHHTILDVLDDARRLVSRRTLVRPENTRLDEQGGPAVGVGASDVGRRVVADLLYLGACQDREVRGGGESIRETDHIGVPEVARRSGVLLEHGVRKLVCRLNGGENRQLLFLTFDAESDEASG